MLHTSAETLFFLANVLLTFACRYFGGAMSLKSCRACYLEVLPRANALPRPVSYALQ
jgi:hypothetical protein